MQFSGVADALTEGSCLEPIVAAQSKCAGGCADDTSLRIFGKPSVDGKRRVAVGLARGTDIATARAKVCSGQAAVID